jgi:hypothetical protein
MKAAMIAALLDIFVYFVRKRTTSITLLWGIGLVTFPWQGLPSRFNFDDAFSRHAQVHACADELAAFIQNIQASGDDVSEARYGGIHGPLRSLNSYVGQHSSRVFSALNHRLLLISLHFTSEL